MNPAVMRKTLGSSPRDYLHYIDYAAYRAAGGYRALQTCLAGRADAHVLLRHVERTALQERGEAPAHPSAGSSGASEAPRLLTDSRSPRVIGVHIGTAEGCTAADLARLQHDPHRLLEGLLITAWLCDSRDVRLVLHGTDGADCHELLAHEIECLGTELPVADLPQLQLCAAGDPALTDVSVPLALVRTVFRVRGLAETSATGHP